MDTIEQDIFRQGSTTYYWSSRFFPKDVRQDVHRLYSFVRTVDDCVDKQPQQTTRFHALRSGWTAAIRAPHFDAVPLASDTVDRRVIKNMVYVSNKYALDPAWVEAFLGAMQSDIEGKTYKTLDDTLSYTYGSAEVIGLMMAKMMHIPLEAYEAARLQGRAMQYINFIRDIAEDTQLGRTYFPSEELHTYGLPDLHLETAQQNSADFKKCIRAQIQRYRGWQAQAQRGYRHIPKRLRIPLKTAANMYGWTAEQIRQDPFIVFEQKVKPGKARIVLAAITPPF
jgi:phytoene synthase